MFPFPGAGWRAAINIDLDAGNGPLYKGAPDVMRPFS